MRLSGKPISLRLGWLALSALTLVCSIALKQASPFPPASTPESASLQQLTYRARSFDLLSRVGAVPLAKGLAVVPLWGLPDQAFHNPAGIAGLARLSLTHNHSFRHFPLDEEVDLVDADTEVMVVPLPSGFTAAYATTLRGEHGWDYLKLAGTPFAQSGFPIERTDGYRDVIALAFSPLPFFALGTGLVTDEMRQFDQNNRLLAIHQGQGIETGYLVRFLGLSLGGSRLKLDFDTFDLTARLQRGWRMWRKLTGIAFTPTPWFSISTQWGNYQVKGAGETVYQVREPFTASTALSLFPGVTLSTARRGNRSHLGLMVRFGPLGLTYSRGEEMMNELHNQALTGMKDLGIYGITLSLPW